MDIRAAGPDGIGLPPKAIIRGLMIMQAHRAPTSVSRSTVSAALCLLLAFAAACTEDSFLDLMERERNTALMHGVPPLSLTDNGDGTVTDNLTTLEWTKCSADDATGVDDTADCAGVHGKYSWGDAIGLCGGLIYAGHDDWRLPSFAELASIIDYAGHQPAIRGVYFPNTHYKVEAGNLKARYWTSTGWYDWPGFSMYIDFADGFFNVIESDRLLYTRCVRGNPVLPNPVLPNPDYSIGIDEMAGTVYDNATSLRWMRCSMLENGQADPDPDCSGTHGVYTWNQAVNACSSLTFGGRSDWRLPTIRELFSLVTYAVDNSNYLETRSIDGNAFPWPGVGYDGSSHYWSYTSYAESPHVNAWTVDFYLGGSTKQIKVNYDNPRYVRCVAGPD